MKMKETELKLYPCYCGGEMKIKKVAQDGGMDGTYYNWELTCKRCGLAMSCAADGFYGRKYKTFEEVVGDWNRNRKKEKTITVDVLDKIRAEIEKLNPVDYGSIYSYEIHEGAAYMQKDVLAILDEYSEEK